MELDLDLKFQQLNVIEYRRFDFSVTIISGFLFLFYLFLFLFILIYVRCNIIFNIFELAFLVLDLDLKFH